VDAFPRKQLRVLGTKPFMRFASNFGVSHDELVKAMADLPEANLGGGVCKYRIARKGEGKSGGARLIVAMKIGARAVLMFGFEKKDLGNIRKDELTQFKRAARIYLSYTDRELDEIIRQGAMVQLSKPAKR